MTANAGGEAVSKPFTREDVVLLNALGAKFSGFQKYRRPGATLDALNDLVVRIEASLATPTDAGLREALEKIAKQWDDEWDDHCGHIVKSGGQHEDTCPYEIARAALSQGGSE